MPETSFHRKELTKCIVRFVCIKTPKYFAQDGLTEHVLSGCNIIQNMDYLQSLILNERALWFLLHQMNLEAGINLHQHTHHWKWGYPHTFGPSWKMRGLICHSNQADSNLTNSWTRAWLMGMKWKAELKKNMKKLNRKLWMWSNQQLLSNYHMLALVGFAGNVLKCQKDKTGHRKNFPFALWNI